MAQACSVCTSGRRREIDDAIFTGQPYRRIAADFGVAETSLRRHAFHHLGAELERTKMLNIEALSDRLAKYTGYAERVLERAEASGDDHTVLMGVETAGRTIERLYRINAGDDRDVRLRAVQEQVRQLAAPPVREGSDADAAR